MDLVSIETQEENNMIFRLIQQSKLQKLFCFDGKYFIDLTKYVAEFKIDLHITFFDFLNTIQPGYIIRFTILSVIN